MVELEHEEAGEEETGAEGGAGAGVGVGATGAAAGAAAAGRGVAAEEEEAELLEDELGREDRVGVVSSSEFSW